MARKRNRYFALGNMLYLLFLLPVLFKQMTAEDFCYPPPTCNTTSLTNLAKNNTGSYLDLTLRDASSVGGEDMFDLYKSSRLFCCFVAQPFCPVIHWFKDGVQLLTQRGVREVVDGGRCLHVFSAKKSDAGVYTCNATTPYNERASFVINVKVELKCDDPLYVDGKPAGNVIKVRRGSSQTLQCDFYCHGNDPLGMIAWKKGGNQQRMKNSTKYKITIAGGKGVSGPNEISTLTVFNFTESENFTCFLEGTEFSGNYSFCLVPKECEGDVSVTSLPSGVDHIVVEKGSKRSVKCRISCLKKERFEEAVWRDQNNKPILNNTSKYISSRREILKSDGRDYEITLTILNITMAETVSCFLPNGQSNISSTFHLVLKPEAAAQTPEEKSYFESRGVWILIACLLAILVLSVSSLLVWSRKRVRTWSQFYRPNKPELDAKYDAFVSFSEADGGTFVRSTLVPMLEEECGYCLSLHDREFIPGTAIVENITDFMDNSRRIITIVTPKFLKSEWCRFEVDQGLRRAVERPNTLVVIMLDEIPRVELPKTLQHFISKINFLQWNPRQLDRMREKLSRALGTPLTISQNEKSAENHNGIVVDNIRLSAGSRYEDINAGNFKDSL